MTEEKILRFEINYSRSEMPDTKYPPPLPKIGWG